MARGINKVILVGTVGKDPEVRYSQAGSANVTLSLATNESWKDKNGEKQERTEWHRLKFFGKLAEIAGEYVKKGQQLYVEGSLRTDKYTDKQGMERYTTDIIVSELQLLGGREGRGEPPSEGNSAPRRAPVAAAPAPASRQAPAPRPASGFDDMDDDIPF